MKHEDEVREALAKSAAKLDDIETATPDFTFFKGMVTTQQAVVRRTQKRQLVLFVIVAALLVSGIVLCMGKFQFLFIILQGMAVSGAIAGLVIFSLRTRRLKEGYR